MIERLVVTGLINSTEFIQQIRQVWDPVFMESRSARLIAEWCIEFYDEFNKAPERNIEDIYFDKKESRSIPIGMEESVEEDLEDLSAEYDESFNLLYALKRANKYFKRRHLEEHQSRVKALIENGDDDAAHELAGSYSSPIFELTNDLDMGSEEAQDRIEHVFTHSGVPLLEYPGALGAMMNEQMVRGGFVALMSSEKRGKSFWLLDMAIRATVKKSKVAFFQAGDMTEGQQLKRICSYLAKKPVSEKYVGEMFVPRIDCIYNQLNECEREDRACGFGVFTGGEFTLDDIRGNVTKKDLLEAYEFDGKDYKPCNNCVEFRSRPWGTPWLVPITIKHALTMEESKTKVKQFFAEKKRRFKISSHANSTLSIPMIKGICDRWERADGFVPDVIVIDYADLLITNKTQEFRHAQNTIWKDLRALSQERDCLVLTATQADAKSYDQNLLRMGNFSEDKRKHAHVTAEYGLNQDKHGREKKLGLMRINEIAIREGEFDITNSVTVLQNLNLGRPFIDCYL